MGWTITWNEFKSYADDLIAVSDEINDGWIWQGDKDYSGGAFIMKKLKRQFPEEIFILKQEEKDLFEDSSFLTEDESAVVEPKSECREIIWEYHILYSPSYATPVLYFNAFTLDGCLLSLEILWKGLQGAAQDVLQDMRYEALSQQEHPILRRPFFQLHPCKTAQFLKVHHGISCNPIVTWLSSMGPAVALNLDNRYSRLVQDRLELKQLLKPK